LRHSASAKAPITATKILRLAHLAGQISSIEGSDLPTLANGTQTFIHTS